MNIKEILYTTNKEEEIKVYIIKNRIHLGLKEIAILYDKPAKTINNIIFKMKEKTVNKHIKNIDEKTLYDSKIINKIGEILESNNSKLLKEGIKDIKKKERDLDYKKLYFIDSILDAIFNIFN